MLQEEKCCEYNIPLCVVFVNYEKALDSVQTQAILTSLQEQGIEDVYIEILKDIRRLNGAVKLGEQGREDRRRMAHQSPLC